MTRSTPVEPVATSDAPPPLPERYEHLEVLGQGAMGIVYKARDRDLDRIVAIKTLHPKSAARGRDVEAIAARLYREAKAAARLAHPGIVAVYDVGRVGQTPYIVMEYFTGRTLAELLEAGPLAPARAVHIILEVCRALDYAHAQGVVHRDIKTSNIMVDARGNAKLSDFGVARMLDTPTSETRMLVGTPAYMSPEQARGAPGDGRSDLFAVGVVLYEALTGAKAFPGEDVAAVLEQVLHVDPVPPRELNFGVSPALDAVVRRAIEKAPEERYRDAAAFAEALMQTGASVGGLMSAARGRSALLIGGAILIGVAAGIFATPFVGRVVRTPPSASDERDAATTLQRDRASTAEPPAGMAATPVTPKSTATPSSDSLRAQRVVEAQDVGAKRACLSVNAVPYAKVYVDGRVVGETPQACVRVRQGQRRIQFEWGGERSPDFLVTVAKEHTADNPLRASYDFRAGRFVSSTE